MHECLLYVCFVSFSGDRIERRLCRGGEVFEYQEEGDQGQANQVKPSICCISESYQVTMHCSILALVTMHCFSYIAINP
jgi:hypothetical protein